MEANRGQALTENLCDQAILEAMTAGAFTVGSGIRVMPVMLLLTKVCPRAAIQLLQSTSMQHLDTFLLERVYENSLLPSIALASGVASPHDCKVRYEETPTNTDQHDLECHATRSGAPTFGFAFKFVPMPVHNRVHIDQQCLEDTLHTNVTGAGPQI